MDVLHHSRYLGRIGVNEFRVNLYEFQEVSTSASLGSIIVHGLNFILQLIGKVRSCPEAGRLSFNSHADVPPEV